MCRRLPPPPSPPAPASRSPAPQALWWAGRLSPSTPRGLSRDKHFPTTTSATSVLAPRLHSLRSASPPRPLPHHSPHSLPWAQRATLASLMCLGMATSALAALPLQAHYSQLVA